MIYINLAQLTHGSQVVHLCFEFGSIDIAAPNCIPFVAKDVPESIQANQHHMKHIEITKKENFVWIQ